MELCLLSLGELLDLLMQNNKKKIYIYIYIFFFTLVVKARVGYHLGFIRYRCQLCTFLNGSCAKTVLKLVLKKRNRTHLHTCTTCYEFNIKQKVGGH